MQMSRRARACSPDWPKLHVHPYSFIPLGANEMQPVLRVLIG